MSTAIKSFKYVLRSFEERFRAEPLSIAVCIDLGSLCALATPYANSNGSPIGLTIDEILEIAMIAGTNNNVWQ